MVELTGQSPQQSSDNLAAAVAAGEIERIVLAGGDGLVHLAIQQLAGTTIPVSVAPTGTGNDFATAIGIEPSDEILLGDTAGDDTLTNLDLLAVETAHGTTWVASVVIAGFPAAINRRANSISLPIGAQVYTLAALIELPSFQRQTLSIELDDSALTADSAMLAIGNTKLFGGGMLPCPDADPTDGLLDLTSIEGVGRIGLAPHLIGRAGGTSERPEVLRLTSTSITIDTPGIDLWGDGEPLGETPATIRAVPDALWVAGADIT